MIKNLILLMRPKHYLKNALIFAPLVFSGSFFSANLFVSTLFAFIAFSAVASIVYIVNDIKDVDKDRKHPKKKFRPIASGKITISQALILATFLLILTGTIGYLLGLSVTAWALLAFYLLVNISYSFGLKNMPIIDIGILASGFVVRVIFGAEVLDIEVSRWLYLTVLAGAFYLSLGKRRNEIKTVGTNSRKVNKFYTLDFLDKNMYVCMALTLVFYSLWATDPAGSSVLFWTIPLVILLLMTYSLNIEREGSLGDPVDVITGDKTLILFSIIYVCLTTYLLYTR